VPAGLVGQWCEELERKFALPSLVATADSFAAATGEGASPVVVASLAAARRVNSACTSSGRSLIKTSIRGMISV